VGHWGKLVTNQATPALSSGLHKTCCMWEEIKMQSGDLDWKEKRKKEEKG